jgi:purine-binding chemotaxis protein CheW
MGRMADARRRARRSDSAPEPRAEAPVPEAREERAAPTDAEPEPDLTFPAEDDTPAPETWVAKEESFTLPPRRDERADPSREKKLVLPASGLASDILALAEGMSVDVAEPVSGRAAIEAQPVAEPAARAAHNISFFASPVREERKQAEAAEHLATFFLSGEEYGVDVRMVQEIIRVTDITHVPRAPAFIKGVINLRGRIIPVIDLKRKLGLGEVDVTRQARIVVVKLKDRLIGLLVDGASQVLKVPVSTIEAAPEEVLEHDAVHSIRGVAKLDKRLIILMDLLKLLAPELRDGATA